MLVCKSVTWGASSRAPGDSLAWLETTALKNVRWAVHRGSVPWPSPLSGTLAFQARSFWEVVVEVWWERWGKACPKGLFPPLLNRTAISVEKQNAAYISGCDHAYEVEPSLLVAEGSILCSQERWDERSKILIFRAEGDTVYLNCVLFQWFGF